MTAIDKTTEKVSNTVKANRSFKWTTLSEAFAKIIAPVMNMILARLIAPEIFGVVASISTIVSFAEIFSEGGFSRYLIQKEFSSEKELASCSGTANIASIFFSTIAFVIVVIFRDSLANLVNSNGYGLYLMLAAIQIPLVGFTGIQSAIEKRRFQYKRLAIIRISSSVVQLLVSLLLAFFGHGFMALIFGPISSSVVQCIFLVCFERKTLSFHFKFSILKTMFGISSLFFGESLLSWLTSSLDVFLVGKFFSLYYVGIYKNAMSTESGIIAVITAIYSTIMVSLLSREQKDMGAMTKILCTYQRLISYLLIPIGIGMFVYRDFLTFVFFGNGWSEAAIVIGLFGITDCFRAATGLFSMSAFTSAGKPLWNIVINATSLIWIVISFFCFSGFGFDTFVIFRSFASVVCSIIALILGWFVLKINPFILLVNLLHPLIYSLIMSGVAFLQMSFSTSTVFNSIGIVACMVSYFLFFFLFDKKDFIFLFRMFAGKEVVAVGEAGCRSNK